MTQDVADAFLAGALFGMAYGLLVGLVVIPAFVDAWARLLRRMRPSERRTRDGR